MKEKTRSVDGLIANVENEMLDNLSAQVPQEKNKIEIVEDKVKEEAPIEEKQNEDNQEYEEAAVSKNETPQETESTQSNLDEYGNPIAKSKTYTEEEVQRMIKDRLKRHNNNNTQSNTDVQQATQNFQYDNESEIPWEQQLESHIEKTIHKIQTRESEKQWQQHQNEIQSEFETKFTSGMERYDDFREVVSKAPITDSMMMATRSMNNPAAFIYAASKNHTAELERISKISDPFTQAREIGNLEAKMVRAKKISSAPRPINTPQGDIPGKPTPKRNIDSLIQKDAERMLRSRR
jgi:hypothetical protein